MVNSDQNSQIVNNPSSPNESVPPGNGDGGGSIRHPPDDLAAQLVARREELELNPEEAAAQIGATPATYRRWEQGKDKPSARFHAAIAIFLGHS